MLTPKTIYLAFLAFVALCTGVSAFTSPTTSWLLPTGGVARYQPAPIHNDFVHLLRAGEITEVDNDEAKVEVNGEGKSAINALVSFLSFPLRRLIVPAFRKLLLAFAAVISFLITALKRLVAYIIERKTGGPLVPQHGPFVYGSPLAGNESLQSETLNLAVQERSLLVTENMYVEGLDGHYCHVKGIRAILSGRDRMKFFINEEQVVFIESKNRSPKYWVHRGTRKGEKIGWIEKREKKGTGSLDFAFYPEPSSTSSPSTTNSTEPQAAYTLDGDFINRRFVMRNDKGEVCAKVKKQLIAFPAFDHYVIRVAAGMDPMMALACTCVIDEELEDEIRKKIEAKLKKAVSATFSFVNPFD